MLISGANPRKTTRLSKNTEAGRPRTSRLRGDRRALPVLPEIEAAAAVRSGTAGGHLPNGAPPSR
jgi:hypothetical protein